MKNYTMTFKHDNGTEYDVNITAKTPEQVRLVEDTKSMAEYFNSTDRTDEWQAGGLQGIIDAMFLLNMVKVDGKQRTKKSYDFADTLVFKHRILGGETRVTIKEVEA